VIHYGSFNALVSSAAKWRPGTVLDLEGAYPSDAEPRVIFERQPLIVVDPVDPKRNVAAPVSMRSFATFVLACRDFVRAPREEFFFPNPPRPITGDAFKKCLRLRGTTLCCLWVKHRGLPEDVVYPQLRKTERAISNELVQAGFEILRSDVWADDRNAAVVVELSLSKLSPVQVRPGPQVPLDASEFVEEHIGSKRRIAGPYVDEAGRVVFEIKRAETDGVRCLGRIIREHRGFGKHIAESIEARRYSLLVGPEMIKLMRNRGFRDFLSDYLDRRLPWYR
jgi:tRNA nucleotidyltransferase (CCA-adding enzyme)